jgi:hypothetical protein
VRDVQHADAALLQPADRGRQQLGLVLGERRGRLVHHEDPRVERQRLDDLDHLLLRHGEAADDRPRAEGDLGEVVQQRPGVGLHATPVDEPAPHGLAAHEDVLGDGAVREEVELLVDDPHPGGLRLRGMVEGLLHAVDPDRAGVLRVHAGEDLHQRRLAGAVLADERVDLAGAQVEVDAVQDVDAEEALADAAHLEQRRGRVGHAGTSVHAPEAAERSTVSTIVALRAPSAKRGRPSGSAPPIAA